MGFFSGILSHTRLKAIFSINLLTPLENQPAVLFPTLQFDTTVIDIDTREPFVVLNWMRLKSFACFYITSLILLRV